MPNSNELRVFISSTFRDMQAEREHLVRKVFPGLRALCRDRGVTFTEIDLRWGLTEEQATMGNVIRACLEEVDRCRPYFIGMIGDRYGWVPELHDIMIDPDLLTRFPFVEELVLDGRSVTEIEFVHALFNHDSTADLEAFFYHRLNSTHEVDDPIGLDRLMERVRERGHPLREYGDLEAFGEGVRRDLVATIDRVWPEESAPERLELERRAHAAFSASRTRGYIPDAAYLKEFRSWISEGESQLLVRGVSGLGKSSLLAYMAQDYRRKRPDDFLLEHYVGASPASGTVAGLISHIVGALCRRFEITGELPTTEEKLITTFPNWLFQAARKAEEEGISILLLLDALNQLRNRQDEVKWLPEQTPENVRIILSTTPGKIDRELVDRQLHQIEVAPLQEERIRQGIVVRYLGEFRKSVSSDQLGRITDDANAESPLFLRTIAEELRLHGEFETIDTVIERYTGTDDLNSFFALVLERFEEDHGADFVRRFMSLIALSRSGLHETDLLELTGSSRIALSRLLFGLDYHLVQREGLFDFFHDYLRRAVEGRYLTDPEERYRLRKDLLAYASELPLTEESTLEMIAQGEKLGEEGYQEESLEYLTSILRRPAVTALLSMGNAKWEAHKVWSRLVERGVDIEETYLASLDKEEVDGAADLPVSLQLGSVATLLISFGKLQAAEQVAGMMIGDEDRDAQLKGHLLLGDILKLESKYDEGMENLQKAMELAEELGSVEGVSNALQNIGTILTNQGKFHEAIEQFERALEIAEREGDPDGITSSCGNLGLTWSKLFNYDKALAYLNRSAAISQQTGNLKSLSAAISNIGSIHFDLEKWEEALDAFNSSAEIDRMLGDLNTVGITIGNRGNVQGLTGQQVDALYSYREAYDIHQEIGFLYGMTYWLSGLSGTLLDIAALPEPPEGLERFLPEITSEEWREVVLREGRRYGVEARDLSTQINKPGGRFTAAINVARIDHLLGEKESARTELLGISDWSDNPLFLATSYYLLWSLAEEEDPERPAWRERSLDYYAQVPEEQIPPIMQRDRQTLLDAE